MNADRKRRWLEALRSGSYQQGKSYLKRTEGDQVFHCCFGVLCEIESLAQEQVPYDTTFFKFPMKGEIDEESRCSIKGDLRADFMRGIEEGRDLTREIENMNDGNTPSRRAFTFSEIAAFIEREIPSDTE